MNKVNPLFAFLFVAALMSACDNDDEEVKNVLVTANRTTGKFYKIDEKTGSTTEIFTPTIGGNTLNELRAFVYHPAKKKFFASANSYNDLGEGDRAGYLYNIDQKTKVAVMINDNDGKVNPTDENSSYAIWDAIVNWVVAPDDSLMGIGDFNRDGNGIVKFGTDGGRSLKTVDADVCCGNGMLYDVDANELLVASGWDADNGTTDFLTIDASTGETKNRQVINNYVGFPADFNEIKVDSDLYMKGLARDERDSKGIIYGILFNDANKSYFVKVDLVEENITYVSTLGEDNTNQYNVLAFIPANLAK